MSWAEVWSAYNAQMVEALCTLHNFQEINIGLIGEHSPQLINNLPRKLAFQGA